MACTGGMDGWMTGRTKVFLKYWHMDALCALLHPFNAAVIVFQVCITDDCISVVHVLTHLDAPSDSRIVFNTQKSAWRWRAVRVVKRMLVWISSGRFFYFLMFRSASAGLISVLCTCVCLTLSPYTRSPLIHRRPVRNRIECVSRSWWNCRINANDSADSRR